METFLTLTLTLTVPREPSEIKVCFAQTLFSALVTKLLLEGFKGTTFPIDPWCRKLWLGLVQSGLGLGATSQFKMQHYQGFVQFQVNTKILYIVNSIILTFFFFENSRLQKRLEMFFFLVLFF